MSKPTALGFGFVGRLFPQESATEHLLIRRPLDRILAFRGRSIDDVVNNPVIKNEIYGYWKLYRELQRHSEVVDLERQWNPLGR
jgi:hypothetical protein